MKAWRVVVLVLAIAIALTLLAQHLGLVAHPAALLIIAGTTILAQLVLAWFHNRKAKQTTEVQQNVGGR